LIPAAPVSQPINCNSIQESSSLEPGNIRDAMCKVFIAILPCGILPALSQYISRINNLGIFEDSYCLRCQQEIPEGLVDYSYDYEALIGILPMCTAENFFQTFCTRVIESSLSWMVRTTAYMEYVFVFDFWKRLIIHRQWQKSAAYLQVSHAIG